MLIGDPWGEEVTAMTCGFRWLLMDWSNLLRTFDATNCSLFLHPSVHPLSSIFFRLFLSSTLSQFPLLISSFAASSFAYYFRPLYHNFLFQFPSIYQLSHFANLHPVTGFPFPLSTLSTSSVTVLQFPCFFFMLIALKQFFLVFFSLVIIALKQFFSLTFFL